MSTRNMRTPENWLKHPDFQNITIVDPDGWDRTPKGWYKSWNRMISRDEFETRLANSTISITKLEGSTE